jgi:5'-nucleotidase
MKILVTNDDGICAPGIAFLAEAARRLGSVLVIAPKEQQSAMSHRITLDRSMKMERCPDFPAEGVEAYSLDGTPADCVRAAFLGAFDEKPDMVFSGINEGANCGFDIQYSATVGAAMEALLYDVPALCFSQERGPVGEVCRAYLFQISEELAGRRLPRNQIWNVNFPRCPLSDCRGILYDRRPCQTAFFDDRYVRKELGAGSWEIGIDSDYISEAEEGTDVRAVLDGYISVGTVTNTVLSAG